MHNRRQTEKVGRRDMTRGYVKYVKDVKDVNRFQRSFNITPRIGESQKTLHMVHMVHT